MGEVVVPDYEFERLTEEFEDRNLRNLFFYCEFKLNMHNGAHNHKVNNKRALIGSVQWALENGMIKSETLGELRTEDPIFYRGTLETIYLMRAGLKLTV